MPNYSPTLPLTIDELDGYKMNKNIKDVIRQNFKMLILTSPGERIMLPDFGAGIRRFLFEPIIPTQFSKIKNRVLSVIFPENPKNKSGVYTITLTSKE